VHPFHRLAAPAVAAEGRGLLVLELEPGHHVQDQGHRGEKAFVDGRRTQQDGLRLEHFRDHVVLVAAGDVEQLDGHIAVALRDPLGDPLSQLSRAVPHGVVKNRDLIFLIVVGPSQITLHDLQGIVPPDHTMTRADCLERQIQPDNLVDFFCDQRREGRQDVRVILDGLFVQLGLNHLIVENPFTGDVLTKGIVGKEDRVSGKIFHHAVRPVQHRRFDENELLRADIQPVAGLDGSEIPVLMVMALQRPDSIGGAIDGSIGNEAHQLRQGTAVVTFGVTCDDEINLFQINFFFQVLDEFIGERFPHGINQHRFFIADKIRIVGGTSAGGVFFPVKFPDFPINFSYPGDMFLDGNAHRNPPPDIAREN